jgi:hypothetical protein
VRLAEVGVRMNLKRAKANMRLNIGQSAILSAMSCDVGL